MPLNPAEKSFFKLLQARFDANPPKPYIEQTFAEHRAYMCTLVREFAGKQADVSYKDITVLARDGYKIPVRIFNHDITEKTPILIMLPACGYINDLFDANCIACSRIAKHAGIRVAVVNHRLAPEYPLPIPMHDGYDVTKYIATHPDEYNIDPNRLFIGGMSSGGNCAAVISNLARSDNDLNIHHQILFNGVYDFLQSNLDYRKYEEQDFTAQREPYWHFIGRLGLSDAQLKSPWLSPYYESDLSNLPPTTILVSEYDGIRSDSEAYYQKLKQAGNKVQKIILPGQTHQTFLMREALSDGIDPSQVIAEVILSNN